MCCRKIIANCLGKASSLGHSTVIVYSYSYNRCDDDDDDVVVLISKEFQQVM
jgi:hypothetical protein